MNIGLVAKFQERLEVSRGNAIWRVIGFIFLLSCFIGIISVSAIFFPYTASFKEEISLLHGHHIQVRELYPVLKTGIFKEGQEEFSKVKEVNKRKFLELMKGNETFLCLYREKILYLTKIGDGLVYYCNHAIPVSENYLIHTETVQNGHLVREMKKYTGRVVALFA